MRPYVTTDDLDFSKITKNDIAALAGIAFQAQLAVNNGSDGPNDELIVSEDDKENLLEAVAYFEDFGEWLKSVCIDFKDPPIFLSDEK